MVARRGQACDRPLSSPIVVAVGIADAGPPARVAIASRARARHQRADGRSPSPAPLALGDWFEAAAGRLAVRRGAVARGAEHGARAARDSLADERSRRQRRLVRRHGARCRSVPVGDVVDRRRRDRAAGRARSGRRRRASRRVGRRSGAGDRRVVAGRQRVRATTCSPARINGDGRPRDRSDAAGVRQHARAHHPSGRARRRAGARRCRRSSIDSRAATRRRSSSSRSLVAVVPPLVTGGLGGWTAALGDLELSRARAARRRVSVRARDLDAGLDRLGADGRGACRAC